MSKVSEWLDIMTGRKEEREQFEHEVSDLRSETERLQGAIQYLVEDAMYEGAIPIDPESLVGRLQEYDSQLIDELVMNRQWDVLGGLGTSLYYDTEMMRDRAIANARYLSFTPLGEWIIRVWTNYGMGDDVSIVCNNEDANSVFQEFWTSERNADILADDNLQYLSDFTLQEGNTFLVFFASKDDGVVTVDEIPPDEITEIVTNRDRKSEKIFYKRVYKKEESTETVYYPDWKAKFADRLDKADLPDNANRADENISANEVLNDIEKNLGTDVVMMHVMHNRKSRSSGFGWPILTSASPYIKAHQRFLEDRLTVAASKAMFTRHKQIKGGSRAMDDVASTLASRLSQSQYIDTNPPPAAGSVELDNEAITTTEKPMTTGASDAKTDGEMFSWMALLGGGLFPTTAGLDTSRWATALAMDKTLAMQWSRYQTFWTAQFRRMVQIVLLFSELYGEEKYVNEEGNPDRGANVSIDTLSLVDFPDVVTSLAQATNGMLLPYLENGIIPADTAKAILRQLWLVMLQALGISASDELASKDAFEIEEEQRELLPASLWAFLDEVKGLINDGKIEELAEYLKEVSND